MIPTRNCYHTSQIKYLKLSINKISFIALFSFCYYSVTNCQYTYHSMLYWIEGDEVKSLSPTASAAPTTLYNLPAQVGRITVDPERRVFFTRDGQLGTSDNSMNFRYVWLSSSLSIKFCGNLYQYILVFISNNSIGLTLCFQQYSYMFYVKCWFIGLFPLIL